MTDETELESESRWLGVGELWGEEEGDLIWLTVEREAGLLIAACRRTRRGDFLAKSGDLDFGEDALLDVGDVIGEVIDSEEFEREGGLDADRGLWLLSETILGEEDGEVVMVIVVVVVGSNGMASARVKADEDRRGEEGRSGEVGMGLLGGNTSTKEEVRVERGVEGRLKAGEGDRGCLALISSSNNNNNLEFSEDSSAFSALTLSYICLD